MTFSCFYCIINIYKGRLNIKNNTKKFRLLEDSTKVISPDGGIPITLYQIEALIDFTDIQGNPVKKGQRGGYIMCEENLSHNGKCWIDQDSMIIQNSLYTVSGNALIIGSEIRGTQVMGNAIIANSQVSKSTIDGTIIGSKVDLSNVSKDSVVINSALFNTFIGQIDGQPVTVADSTISYAWIMSNCVITNSTVKAQKDEYPSFGLYDSNLEKVTYIDPKATGKLSLNLANKEYIMTYESGKPEEAE